MNKDIAAYNNSQPPPWKAICAQLAKEIERGLTEAEGKVWHGAPVWFIAGNPIVGYWVRKRAVQLLFWSGQSFDEPGLSAEGKFKAAQAFYRDIGEIAAADVQRWLAKARIIQWDYKNIVKRRGVLERLAITG